MMIIFYGDDPHLSGYSVGLALLSVLMVVWYVGYNEDPMEE